MNTRYSCQMVARSAAVLLARPAGSMHVSLGCTLPVAGSRGDTLHMPRTWLMLVVPVLGWRMKMNLYLGRWGREGSSYVWVRGCLVMEVMDGEGGRVEQECFVQLGVVTAAMCHAAAIHG